MLALLVAGCSSEPPEEGPGDAVELFYRHLNEGNYGGAKALYSSQARSILEDPDSADDAGFAEWAKLETKEGQIESVNVVSESEEEDAAALDYEIVYTDGSRVQRKVTMVRENGDWKMGLIG
jgi:hypothetical protein